MVEFDAIIVAGGRASRLGGVDKAGIDVAGRRLLDRSRDAVGSARNIAVIGPEVTGGPVAAIAAGLSRLAEAAESNSGAHQTGPSGVPEPTEPSGVLEPADITVVLACDMPFVTAETIDRLVTALVECDAALLTDPQGRRQYLAGAYDTKALTRAAEALHPPQSKAMRDLVRDLRVREVSAQSEEATDCDTWDDVRRASKLLENQ